MTGTIGIGAGTLELAGGVDADEDGVASRNEV